MTKKKVWVTIIGAGLTGAIASAVGFFPDLRAILGGIAGLITAIVTYINGADNEE